MPTTKTTKAIHLNVPAHVHAALFEYSDAIGIPLTKLLNSFLLEQTPNFLKLAALVREARASSAPIDTDIVATALRQALDEARCAVDSIEVKTQQNAH